MQVANSDTLYLWDMLIFVISSVLWNMPCFYESESILVSSEKAKLAFKMENETVIYCRKSLPLFHWNALQSELRF